MLKEIVLLVGHGSRKGGANLEFERFRDALRERLPDVPLEHAYVELAHPVLDDALDSAARRARRVILLPLFLFSAGHVKNDLALAMADARRKFPDREFIAANSLGVHPLSANVPAERTLAVGFEPEKTLVILVARGSSDPDANADFYKLARHMYEGRGFMGVLPCFVGITTPLLKETLETAARMRPERLVVVPYFIFGGVLVERIEAQLQVFAKQYPWIRSQCTPYLWPHDNLLELALLRLREARDGGDPLACGSCQYRVALPGREEHQGGLKALLWSARHSFTHSQAMPHTHAHKPVDKHVLVCTNVDCASRGAVSVVDTLKRKVKAAGKSKSIRITRTSCMGRCGEGPAVAVYPDGIWYRNVSAASAEELADEHLFKDRLVPDIVDNIM